MTSTFNGVFSFFLSRCIHTLVLTKFPLSLFNPLSCQYLTTPISISNDSLRFPFFNGESLAVAFLFVFGCSKRWPAIFAALVLVLQWFPLFHCYILIRMNILVRTLQGSYLVLTYLCFCVRYSLNQGPFKTLFWIQTFPFLLSLLAQFLVSKESLWFAFCQCCYYSNTPNSVHNK